MEKNEVAPFIDELMIEAVTSLSKALRYVYPARKGKLKAKEEADEWNALAEANAVTHMAIAVSKYAGIALPEVPDHSDSLNRRIDLMAFFPQHGLKILTEAKRLYGKEGADRILKDNERLKTFKTNGEETDLYINAKYSVAMVMALTHSISYANSWCDPQNKGMHENFGDLGELAGYLDDDNVYKNRIAVETWYTGNGEEQPCWILYAWSYRHRLTARDKLVGSQSGDKPLKV